MSLGLGRVQHGVWAKFAGSGRPLVTSRTAPLGLATTTFDHRATTARSKVTVSARRAVWLLDSCWLRRRNRRTLTLTHRRGRTDADAPTRADAKGAWFVPKIERHHPVPTQLERSPIPITVCGSGSHSAHPAPPPQVAGLVATVRLSPRCDSTVCCIVAMLLLLPFAAFLAQARRDLRE